MDWFQIGKGIQLIQGIFSSDGQTLNGCTRSRNAINLTVDFTSETSSLSFGTPSHETGLLYSLNNTIYDLIVRVL